MLLWVLEEGYEKSGESRNISALIMEINGRKGYGVGIAAIMNAGGRF